MEYVLILLRFVHIASAVALLGGACAWLYAPSAEGIVRWRGIAIAAVGGLLGSGIINAARKFQSPLPAEYHMLFGIKILLALHVFAVTILATKANNPRRARQLTGVVISGFLVVLISAVLRGITLR